jgi:hypothetical protein
VLSFGDRSVKKPHTKEKHVGPYAQEHMVDDFRVSKRKPIQSSLPQRPRSLGLGRVRRIAETLLLRALDASADALGLKPRAKASSTF